MTPSNKTLEFKKYFDKDTETKFKEKILSGEKIHTIRRDRQDKWGKGIKIGFHLICKSQIKKHFHTQTCTGIQKIKIKYFQNWTPGGFVYVPKIIIDGKMLESEEELEFIKNDGFESKELFFDWFDCDFTGKVIHWTWKRY